MRNILLLIFAAMLAGCSGTMRPGDCAMFADVADDGWAYGDTLEFVFPADTAGNSRHVALCVRHDGAYPYSNLWVEVSMPSADTVHVDTIDIQLADRYGRRLGRGSGVSFIKIDTLVRELQSTDTLVQVRHIMRLDTLAGITQIGAFAFEAH